MKKKAAAKNAPTPTAKLTKDNIDLLNSAVKNADDHRAMAEEKITMLKNSTRLCIFLFFRKTRWMAFELN